DLFSPIEAMSNYESLSGILPEIRNNLDHAATKAADWYKWRNRLLFTGFAVLVSARLAALFW
ncbi:MAG TPA: hypothetical protein VK789_12305, partial [Bryobacteraceae bacterium]|nr:hypothetical protein [Bryobacteraceae bacterium]